MAVYCTEENNKDTYLYETLCSLEQTVDFNKHRLVVSVNGVTEETKRNLKGFSSSFDFEPATINKIIWNDTNLGTAEAINLVWQERKPGENCIKMDDDVLIHQRGWIDLMEEAIRREPRIGQIGLKRKDCIESPERTDFYKSELIMLPHKPGEKWIIAEKVNHVMGTCQMYSSALLDKIGYLYQPHLYGFDDSLASFRSSLAGFINVFLPQIEIDHIDAGDTPYQKWKEDHSSAQWKEYHQIIADYKSGKKSIYYNPYE